MSEDKTLRLLRSALDDLLPAGTSHAACPIPAEVVFDYQEEEDRLIAAGDYRKREFHAGRTCLRNALGRIGYSRRPILPDEDGVPVLPAGAVASVSHSRGYCAAVAAKASDYRAVGLDLEMTNRLSASAITRIVHPLEQHYVRGSRKQASLLFCAKEAFFKMQFPTWQTHANFHDLALAVDPVRSALSIQSIGERFPFELRSVSDQLKFSFRFFGDFVLTVCWLRAI